MASIGSGAAPIVMVAGPTASGKSALAIDLARQFDGVVINGDSMQIYADLQILTARPSAAEEAACPHRLFGVLPAAEVCSVARWLDMAVAEVKACWAEGQLPILCGGTGLYLRALRDGLSPIPEIPDDIRAEVRALHRRLGGEAFRQELASLDPVAATRLPAGDSQRLMRAFEVVRATGRGLDDWLQETPPPPPLPEARFADIVVLPPRDVTYAACDARLDAMLAAGALDEVAALVAQGLPADVPAMKAVGVPELAAYLAGTRDLADALASAKTATRRYAKRQTTWLRHQVAADFVLDTQYSESQASKIFSFVRQFLLTTGT